MSDFLKKEYGVAMSGVKWDIGNFKLWQSTDPNIILFTPKQPKLARNDQGRYQFGVSQYHQQVDDTYKITGGSAIFTITSAIQFDAREFESLKEQWVSEMLASEYRDKVPASPRFIPLNVRNGNAQLLINPASGAADEAHLDTFVGTPGGTISFLVNLTELGAQEWVQGVRESTVIPVGVKMSYEYLRMMPTVGAQVKVHGRRMFRHISADLNVSYDGWLYGGSAQISAAWEKMVRDGAVEITFFGNGLSPELEEIRQELVSTFAEQAQQQLFDSLFQPLPEVEDAQAGDTGGLFGGANFAFKYKRQEEVTDLELTLKFEGWTWLKASMDAELTSLISELDDSYINDVNTQMSAPATILVDADPMLEQVGVSWSASEGKAPESPFFGPEGGNARFTVTSQQINDVDINWRAKVNFLPSDWPVIETSGSGTIGEGGNQVIIKPVSWIGRNNIFLFYHDGENILPPSENDYLVCNVSFEGPHLPHPIKDSARITGYQPLEFSYPLSPDGREGTAKFSAFGVFNGRFVRSRTEQRLSFDKEAAFILVSSDGNVQLASEEMLASESLPRESLERRLLEANARPVIRQTESAAGESGMHPGGNGRTEVGAANGHLVGTVTAVQYTKHGPALHIETYDGQKHTVKLYDNEEAEPFNDGKRRQVEVKLAEGNYAESIAILL